ncbi:MAG: thio(seleno)oxazole modification radical SAM maturase SbtM [Desulfocapsaceae bacterium]|jgi:selenobiotic family peptide radical SAM maturase|nr:thio(seleno)oxazole modification radical SAM maturase SbtM [Desulfocapsaceae bacterium]
MSVYNHPVSEIYPVSHLHFPTEITEITPKNIPEFLDHHPLIISHHPYLGDLARIEYACYLLETEPPPLPDEVTQRIINPTLELIPVQWSGLPEHLSNLSHLPVHAKGFVIIYKEPDTDRIQVKTPSGHDLLALKLTSEETGSSQAAKEAGVSTGTIDDILYAAIDRGLILEPESRLVRDSSFSRSFFSDPEYFRAETFTLQWHITQTCDLNCRHCYDRSDREVLQLDQAIRILDDLYDFCRQHHVFTQVSFTGGNPVLYPYFYQLYQEAADRGFLVAVLGNPVSRRQIEEMIAIQKPAFYQVSLEGLQEHNDYMRGTGHFNRVMNFLDLLKEMGVYSMVMLTLTYDNMGEVIELAKSLHGRVDLFTFNRLAMIGEGVDLVSVRPSDYSNFLERYIEASAANPHMSLKDNFFNLVLHEKKKTYTGGCTGFGCGAAFNFVSLLADGEVHACRKLHSPIGNIAQQSFAQIYHSDAAKRYRAGSAACRECEIRPVCGGCLAVSQGFGRDIFTELDPYCFK